MEKRLLLAALLSLGVLFLWEWFGPRPPRRPPVPTPAPVAAAAPTPTLPATAPAPAAERLAATTEGLVSLANGVSRATFSNRGAIMTSFVLLRHTDEEGRPLELVRA